MTMMFRTCVLAVLVLAFAGEVQAGTIDFAVAYSPTSSITYDGSGGLLSAVGLAVPSVTGEGTSAGDGVTTALPSGTTLSFETGDLLGVLPNGWEFAAGGSLTISSPGDLYYSGVFDRPVDVVDTGNGTFKVLAASVNGHLSPGLVADFGFASGSLLEGGVGLLFESGSSPGQAIHAVHIDSGNVGVADSVVPEPGSLTLACIACIACLAVSGLSCRKLRPRR